MKSNVIEQITDRVIEMMETHGANWTQPWVAATVEHGAPRSAVGRPYSGVNRWMLQLAMMDNGWGQPVFATFKQWKSMGAQVTKGSKGTHVVWFSKVTKEDETGETVSFPILKSFVVFNIDQVQGADGLRIEPDTIPDDNDWEEHVTAEAVLSGSGAVIRNVASDRAFYAPSVDAITLPKPEQFADPAGYYGTALHELVHWTGHESRLNREFGKRFGDEAYAFEELVAEMGAAILCGVTGVTNEPRDDHAKYLNNWLNVLKKDKRALITACSHAEKAARFALDTADMSSLVEAA